MSYLPGRALISATTYTATSGSLSAGASTTFTVPVPGAIVGMHGVLELPLADPGASILSRAWVSAANTVTLRLTNTSTSLASVSSSVGWMIALVSSQ